MYYTATVTEAYLLSMLHSMYVVSAYQGAMNMREWDYGIPQLQDVCTHDIHAYQGLCRANTEAIMEQKATIREQMLSLMCMVLMPHTCTYTNKRTQQLSYSDDTVPDTPHYLPYR